MNVRRFAVILAVIVLEMGLAVGLSGVAEAAPVLTASPGSVNCTSFVSAGAGFNSKLTPSGTANALTLQFKGKLSSCTGGTGISGETLVGGTVGGSGSFVGSNVNTCSNFQGNNPADSVGTLTIHVRWTLNPPLVVQNSVVTYTGHYAAVLNAGFIPSGPPFTLMDLFLGASSGSPYTQTTVTGSYAQSILGGGQSTSMYIALPAAPPSLRLTGCPIGKTFRFTGKMGF